MGSAIWVMAEHDGGELLPITFELLAEARRLAERVDGDVSACLFGTPTAEQAAQLGRHGAVRVLALAHARLADYDMDCWCHALAALVAARAPAVLMLGDTARGSELAPRVAARLRLPCVTAVKKLTGSLAKLQVTKAVCNERVYAAIEAHARRPLLLTLPPGETDTRTVDAPAASVETCAVDLDGVLARTRIRRTLKADPRTIAIEEAERIVAVGRGVAPAALPLLHELAACLGAAIGGSRAAVDAGLIPRERQIGISGRTVTPKLLLTCGISGASQFIAGMENSGQVVAVNSDASARIFEQANLRIHGDLEAVVPALVARLRASPAAVGEPSAPLPAGNPS